MSRLNRTRLAGFSLLETMIAMTILSVGLLSMAALLARTAMSSNSSRYMSTQSLLASEKLDDLSRLPASDPDIAVPAGKLAGSLAADTSQNVVVNGITYPVDYFDEVQIANGNGALSETSTATNAAGATVYTTTTHSLATGNVTQTQSTNAPASSADTLTFKRRWIVEQDVPVVGVRRVTVTVAVQTVPPAAPFQMSMVRP